MTCTDTSCQECSWYNNYNNSSCLLKLGENHRRGELAVDAILELAKLATKYESINYLNTPSDFKYVGYAIFFRIFLFLEPQE